MIGFIKGAVFHKEPPFELLVDTGNVGYTITVNSAIFNEAHIGEPILLFTYQHVREDILALYGFTEHRYIALFKKLLGVSGIGPKSAMQFFEIGSPDELIVAIINENVDFITKVPGVGKKTAQRVVLELKNQLADFEIQSENISVIHQVSAQRDEVVAALQQLGYKENVAQQMALEIPEDITDIADQITYALQQVNLQK